MSRGLLRVGLTPNQVSIFGILFALAAAVQWLALADADPVWRLLFCIGAGICVLLRLVCNLLDGLMAIEGGVRTRTGEFFNEMPERISDCVLLVAAGYAAQPLPGASTLGWAAALAALATAYVRLLGVTLGKRADFCGPFAKPQRMAVLGCASLAGAAEAWVGPVENLLWWALLAIVVGTAVTVVRRVVRLYLQLKAFDAAQPDV